MAKLTSLLFVAVPDVPDALEPAFGLEWERIRPDSNYAPTIYRFQGKSVKDDSQTNHETSTFTPPRTPRTIPKAAEIDATLPDPSFGRD